MDEPEAAPRTVESLDERPPAGTPVGAGVAERAGSTRPLGAEIGRPRTSPDRFAAR